MVNLWVLTIAICPPACRQAGCQLPVDHPFTILASKVTNCRLMFTLNCKGRLLLAEKPLVMGIINVTPDSFYEGSRLNDIDTLLKQAEKMLAEGADILDIGGQSTRPGSVPIDTKTELNRVIPAIEAVNKNFPGAFISVDTYSSVVSKKAVEAGAALINDISAGSMDPAMIETAALLHVPYILMHM